MKEDAITTFNRRLRILAMFKGSEPLTTQMIFNGCRAPPRRWTSAGAARPGAAGRGRFSGSGQSRRQTVAVALAQGPEVHDLAPVVRSRGTGVSVAGAVSGTAAAPEFLSRAAALFRRRPGRTRRMPFWAPVKNWETKVRIVPPAQPLLPPEPPPALATATARKDWERQQDQFGRRFWKPCSRTGNARSSTSSFGGTSRRAGRFIPSLTCNAGRRSICSAPSTSTPTCGNWPCTGCGPPGCWTRKRANRRDST